MTFAEGTSRPWVFGRPYSFLCPPAKIEGPIVFCISRILFTAIAPHDGATHMDGSTDVGCACPTFDIDQATFWDREFVGELSMFGGRVGGPCRVYCLVIGLI